MLENITQTPQILGEQDTLSVSEFIKGRRLRIVVNVTTASDVQIDIQQDVEFNSRVWNKPFSEVELERWWETLGRVYRVDEFKLGSVFMNAYTIHCITFDEKLMANHPQTYPPRGLIVVEVTPHNGTALPQNGLEEFCKTVGLPCNKERINASASRVVQNLQEFLITSDFAKNGVPSGLVIKNHPAIATKEGSIQRWFMEPNLSVAMEYASEEPDAMVQELIRSQLTNPELIEDIHKRYNVDPTTHKTKFRNVLFKVLREENAEVYHEYLKRCAFKLDPEYTTAEEKFDKKLKKMLLDFVSNFVLSMNIFAHRV